MFKIAAPILVTTLLTPLLGFADTLELPPQAQVEFSLIEPLTLNESGSRRDDVVMRPVTDGNGTHSLPQHCVVIGSASLDDERIRLSATSMTCIETHGGDSEIYSSEIAAAAYDADGRYGLPACEEGRCELGNDRSFMLQFTEAVSIEPQANPSAELNEQRRQAEGDGVANPIPAESPAPDDAN
ncbi:hypothetical protein KG088_10065 [Halomonas sp. TRM85114]|uniref:hypothetical protein n=1 Tax=Halomonas jincaotanensis TaxID=2810616 RepID=UPI001BD29F69|nr:hypothetical protein [Halomonas jincaotanensis]MBS9403974.1 hypothetical protein [Halomonas jincaotanensis]